jgi:two-component system heavy metal sensor histidine kinase CusS
LFEYFEALADEKGLHLRLTGHTEVEGDKLMLHRALANLLANVIRHTLEGGRSKVA